MSPFHSGIPMHRPTAVLIFLTQLWAVSAALSAHAGSLPAAVPSLGVMHTDPQPSGKCADLKGRLRQLQEALLNEDVLLPVTSATQIELQVMRWMDQLQQQARMQKCH